MKYRTSGYRPVLLLHVTPERNRASILAHGIRPQLARGRRKVVWLAKPARLKWALAHVEAHQRVSQLDLAVCVVDLHRYRVVRRRYGIYTCDTVIECVKMVTPWHVDLEAEVAMYPERYWGRYRA